MDNQNAVAFFRNEFELEAEAGFPRLSRIPDTSVRKFLKYFRNLPEADAEPLKNAIARQACYLFGPMGVHPQLISAEYEALENRNRALMWMTDWQFMSVKTLKMEAGMARSEHPAMKKQMAGFQMPEEVLKWIDGFTPCKAADLRKLVKAAFASRFGLTPENRGGGDWLYRPTGESESFAVEISYGSSGGQQLGYSIYLKARRPGDAPGHLRFDTLMGAGVGHWDFITESTADQDIALLVDLVEYVLNLPKRLAQAGA